nr:MAG: major capsid protein [Microvirus sp.]
MKIRSASQHAFSQVPRAEIPRSSFDRSHTYKTTFDAGLLIPIFVDEALPGDTFNLSMTGFARLATPIVPIMDNMYMETFFFAVPHRLLWDNWERFCGAQTDPGDSTDFLIPQVASATGAPSVGSIYDYMGIPTTGSAVDGISVNALPFRAYNLIYNEWFRDENLIDSKIVETGNGPENGGNYGIWRRGKRHDYFTSCLPWPQKGDGVSLPLGTTAPITGIGWASTAGTMPVDGGTFNETGGASVVYPNASDTSVANGLAVLADPLNLDQPAIYADLSLAASATINQLRQAFQIQRLLERDARGGTRYTEILKAHFGVTSPDARLQRPEYLGGGRSNVNISPVAQTSETTATTPQANLAAFGTASLRGHGFTKSFTEHCVIIGIVSVRADLTYQQGLNRMWSRQTRFDYYWPALSHIGEQAVLNKEIYYQGVVNDAVDNEVFGYQERFAEYRYKPSMITGLFRSTAAASLDVWHLSQEFTALPVLDATFIEDNPPVDRVIAVDSEPHFLFDSLFNLRCARPMPMFGVPGLIDHF